MEVGELRRALLRWYGRHGRSLPWRETDEVAPVLVSEFMLQQTRVAAVLPYFERFMVRFPTLDDIAEAEPEKVLSLWQGLGYYARARNLHRTARLLARDGLPKTQAGWRALPGVGEYTAAALASRLQGVPAACVDGNVERVLTRLRAIENTPSKARLRETAAALLHPRRPGDWNQAMMELGATVCLPGEPRCGACPLAGWCEARRRGLTDRIPARAPGRKPVPIHHVCAVCVRAGRVLLRKAPPGGWWEGLWEFPRVARADGEGLSEAGARAAAEEGVRTTGGALLPTVRHTVTHHRITLHPVLFALNGRGRRGRWADAEELTGLPLPAPQRKVAERLTPLLAR